MKKAFKTKSKVKKNSKIYKDLEKGEFSPKKIKKRVRSQTKKLKKLVINNDISKHELKSKLENIGVRESTMVDMVNIAITTKKEYEKKLQDKDWRYTKEETEKKAWRAIETAWSREVSNIALEDFVEMYRGYKAIWIPSSSKNPRFEHMPHYGEVFIVGEGVDSEFSKKDLAIDLGSTGLHPAQEWGCNCGIQIIFESGTNETYSSANDRTASIPRNGKRKVA